MRRIQQFLGVAMACAVVTAIAACGSSSNSSSTSSPSGSNSSTSAAAGTTTTAAAKTCSGEQVKFLLSFFPNAQHVGFLVAQHRNYYKDVGLNVATLPGGPNVNPVARVAQGSVDIALTRFSDFIQAVDKGADLVWVGQLYQRNPYLYLSLKKSGIVKPADMKGKTVGTQNPGSVEAELQGILASAGLTVRDVKIKAIDPSVATLLNGQVDVFPALTFFHIAQLEGEGKKFPADFNVIDPNKYNAAVAGLGLAVNRDFYTKHKAAVKCFLEGAVRGWDDAAKDPKGALPDVMAAQQKGLATEAQTAKDIDETLKLVDTMPDGRPVKPLAIDKQYLEESQQRLLKGHGIEKMIDLNKYVDAGTVEAARAAVDGG